MNATNLPTPIPFATLRGHIVPVNTIDFSNENNHRLYSGDLEGNVFVWDVLSLKKIEDWKAHEATVLTVQSISAQKVVTSGRDGFIKVWDAQAQQPICIMNSHCQHFCNISSSYGDEGNVIISSDSSSNVLVWDTRLSNAFVGSIENPRSDLGMVMAVLQGTSEPSLVISGHEDGSVVISDIRKMQPIHFLSRQHSEPVFAIATSEQNLQHIYSGGGDNFLRRYQLSSREGDNCSSPQWMMKNSIELPQNGTSSIAIRSDGRIIATSHWDHTIRLWDQKKLKCLGIFRHHKESVFSVRFGRKGTNEQTIFASCAKDGQIALWNLFDHTFRIS